MPFWLANLLERMWLCCCIIMALLLPLSRIVPPLYEFGSAPGCFAGTRNCATSRVVHEAQDNTLPALLEDLDQLETRVGKVVVPLSHADELYALRNHIDLIRNKLLAKH